MASTGEYDPLAPVRDAFDARYYLAANPDVAASQHSPFDHFMESGWREGRKPTPYFETALYLSLNPDVAEAGVNPFVHYILYGRDEGRSGAETTPDDLDAEVRAARTSAFDAAFYRNRNPDIPAEVDALDHFLRTGWREGRDPNPWFSVAAYLDAHADVREMGGDPLTHYIQHGRAEGRSLGNRPLPGAAKAAVATAEDAVRQEFDADFYLTSNAELGLTQVVAFDHFMEQGWREGRDPNRDFSVTRYLHLNPDVHAAGLNPFEHYVRYGRGEGRPTSHGFDFRNDILRNTPVFEDHLSMLRRSRPDPAPDPIELFEAALTHSSRPRRLHVTISQDNYAVMFGGIQLCLRLESDAVRAAGTDHLHLFPASGGMVVEVNRNHPPVGVVLNGNLLGIFAAAEMVEAIARADQRPDIDFAVHSLIGHTVPDLVDILDAFGAHSGIYWVHDYSSLCAGYALMRNDVNFCGAPPVDSAACGVCMYGPRRRIQIAEHVKLFDRFSMSVIAPSDTALSLWRRSFPRTPDRTVAQPHAVLAPANSRPRPSPRQDEPVRIGFLGMPSHHKGWPVFAALLESFRQDPRYEFHHLAHSPAPGVRAVFTEVSPTTENPMPMSGAVAALGLDVAIIWSLWPETFCFTAFEAVAGGALILTNPGAGNVTVFARDPSHGRVLDSEAALFEMLGSGELIEFARKTTRAGPTTLSYTGMSADLLEDQRS